MVMLYLSIQQIGEVFIQNNHYEISLQLTIRGSTNTTINKSNNGYYCD